MENSNFMVLHETTNGNKPLGGHINLMENYVAATWHVNAVSAPQSPHERTAALLNTAQLNLRSQLFFSSKNFQPCSDKSFKHFARR